MTLGEILSQIRLLIDDAAGEKGIRDADLISLLNDKQSEFGVRTLCFYTSSVVNYTAGEPLITLPENTIWVVGAQLADGTDLRVVTQSEMNNGFTVLNAVENTAPFSAWKAETGTPKFLITDYGPQTARLAPYPDASSIVTIERYITPAAISLSANPDVVPSIPVQFQHVLVAGVAADVLKIPDLEVFDLNRSILQQNVWEAGIQRAIAVYQTDIRKQERIMSMQDGFVYGGSRSNTNGTVPVVNTETA